MHARKPRPTKGAELTVLEADELQITTLLHLQKYTDGHSHPTWGDMVQENPRNCHLLPPSVPAAFSSAHLLSTVFSSTHHFITKVFLLDQPWAVADCLASISRSPLRLRISAINSLSTLVTYLLHKNSELPVRETNSS